MSRDFDGVDDIINCGNPVQHNDLANWTHCCWFNADTVGELSLGTMCRKNANDAGLGKVLHLEATNTFRGAARRATTNLSLEASDNTISLSTWTFVAFTYDGTTGKLFKGLPGGVVAEVSYKVNTQGSGALTADNGGALTIGNDITAATTFDGRIKYLRWLKKALSAQELTSVMYNQPLARPWEQVGFWPLGLPHPEPDLSGYAAHGKVTGAIISATNPPVPPPYLDDKYYMAWAAAASGTLSVNLAARGGLAGIGGLAGQGGGLVA